MSENSKDAVNATGAVNPTKDTMDAKTVLDTKDPALPNATNDGSSLNEAALKERDTEKAKQRGDQPERPARKCGCACDTNCNCKCTCACRDHCVCKSPCDGKCGDRVSRNLVISIDGTSNQFGIHNTNVVELHSRILADESANQSKYYNSGIGTYVPPEAKASLKYWQQQLENGLDLAFALNFKDTILKAYRWLSQTYKTGDKIYFFGFSRGAYQVRTLAGMIETVGLVDPGNEELIPLFVLYVTRATHEAQEIAKNFKRTFSRDVKVHFVGVWDTVSSVGVFRGKPLPLASSARHICTFRHALALDECRVKFLPEYVDGGSSSTEPSSPTDVKEVWFAGTHSDIGGGIKKNLDLNLSSVPLLWMENEAASAGLRLRPRATSGGAWNMADLQKDDLHQSLAGIWWALEYCPLTRLSYKMAEDLTMTPHRGAGRVIAPGQHIHISVAFKSKNYLPRATFRDDTGIKWESFVGKDVETGTFDWADQWVEEIEMDLFDTSFMTDAIQNLKELWSPGDRAHNTPQETLAIETYWIKRLEFMALSGKLAANYLSKLEGIPSENKVNEVHTAVELFRKLQEERPGSFDSDVAALLEYEAHLLDTMGQREKALGTYQEAETIRRKAVTTAEKPRVQDIVDLASCLERISYTLTVASRHPDALHTDKEAVRLRRQLADTDPSLTATKNLARSLNKLGLDFSNVGCHEDALHADGEAVVLYRKLSQTDPAAVKDLALSLHILGIDLDAVGHHERALYVDEEAVDLYRKLAETDPTVMKDLAQTLRNLAIDLRTVHRPEKTWQVDEEAVEILRNLAETDPTVSEDLVQSLHDLAFDLRDVARHETARLVVAEAVGLCRKLADTDPTLTRVLASSLYDQACILRAGGHHEDALGADEEAVELRRRLADMDPSISRELAQSLQNLGWGFNLVGRYKDAVRTNEEAAAFSLKLPETHSPPMADIANTMKNLSHSLRAVGRHEDASRAYERGAEIYRKLAETDPLSAARSLHESALALHSVGFHDDALDAAEGAVKLYRTLARTNPDLGKSLIDSLEVNAKVLRALGHEEDATHTEIEIAQASNSAAEPGRLVSAQAVKETVEERGGTKTEEGDHDPPRVLRRAQDARTDTETVEMESAASQDVIAG
ncbi:hypothetical protein DFH09DRAFT_995913 [Mycena vulgaris]|nr:hypothetical protein DFH09DRAFT_995913 [Mycena vulgaris]